MNINSESMIKEYCIVLIRLKKTFQAFGSLWDSHPAGYYESS